MSDIKNENYSDELINPADDTQATFIYALTRLFISSAKKGLGGWYPDTMQGLAEQRTDLQKTVKYAKTLIESAQQINANDNIGQLDTELRESVSRIMAMLLLKYANKALRGWYPESLEGLAERDSDCHLALDAAHVLIAGTDPAKNELSSSMELDEETREEISSAISEIFVIYVEKGMYGYYPGSEEGVAERDNHCRAALKAVEVLEMIKGYGLPDLSI